MDNAVDMAAFTAQSIGESEAATFVAAVDGTIVSWSESAERLLRRPAWAVLGKPCHEVVRGLGLDGSEVCRADCPIRLEARLGVAPNSQDLLVQRGPAGARSRMVRVHHVTLKDPLGYVSGLLHVLEPSEHPHSRKTPA